MAPSQFRSLPLWLAFAFLFPTPYHASSQPAQKDGAHESPLVYRLTLPAPISHRLHVRITDDHPPVGTLEFAIPAWTPGYYQILDYQADIEHVHAADERGRALPVTHPSARVWAVDTTGNGPNPMRIELDYDVHAHDAGLGFFGSLLDGATEYGYINGASALLYEVGKTQRPAWLDTALPDGWKLATSLTPRKEARMPLNGTPSGVKGVAPTAFEADSYDALIDSPLQFGQFTSTEFVSDGAAFECVCVGSRDWDRPKVSAILQKIVHAAIRIFGKPPFKRYVFFYHIGGSGFTGGLEHRNATVIHVGLPLKDGKGEEFQTVTAHEFFHAWNVKRLRPAGLGPFDYTQPVRTPSLWWAEGVTDYYADILLYRAGLQDKTWLLTDLADRISELDNNPARLRVSLEEAGRKAWEGESEGFDGLSYYLKGSLVGLYFDLRLRELTNGRRSLDDVMRLLEADYGSKNRSYPEGALLSGLEAVAQTDLHAEYAGLVRAKEEIPWDNVLGAAGLSLSREGSSYLGVQLHSGSGMDDGLVIDAIETGSAAARGNLHVGDHLLTLNGDAVSLDSLKDRLAGLQPHAPVVLTVLRGGEKITVNGDSGLRYAHHQLLAAPRSAGVLSGSALFQPTIEKGNSTPIP